MSDLDKDHVKPEERLFGRRRDDLLGFRTAYVVLFLIVTILVAFGFAQKLDDMVAEREAVQLAEQAAQVVHKLRINCGI